MYGKYAPKILSRSFRIEGALGRWSRQFQAGHWHHGGSPPGLTTRLPDALIRLLVLMTDVVKAGLVVPCDSGNSSQAE